MRLVRTSRAARRAPQGSVALWMVLVCLLVLAVLTAVQVGHVHVNDADSDHCSLCILLQTAAPVAIAVAAIVLVTLGSHAPLVEQRVTVRPRTTRIFIRPPPSGC